MQCRHIATCVLLINFAAACGAKASAFPAEAREQLDKLRVALRTVYLEVEHTSTLTRPGTYTFTAYFEGDRLRVKAPSDVAFDGVVQ